MFCDSPTQCCRYQVFAPDGTELDPKLFNLHMVYDGNPPGLGMGIVAEPTLHRFGEVPSYKEVAAHVRSVLRRTAPGDLPYEVVVHQHHFFSADNQVKRDVKVWMIHALEDQK